MKNGVEGSNYSPEQGIPEEKALWGRKLGFEMLSLRSLLDFQREKFWPALGNKSMEFWRKILLEM